MDNHLSIPDAAATFGVTPKTIRRWIKDGKVTAYKQVTDRGFEWRIDVGSDTQRS